jgi:hypothetical protein
MTHRHDSTGFGLLFGVEEGYDILDEFVGSESHSSLQAISDQWGKSSWIDSGVPL